MAISIYQCPDCGAKLELIVSISFGHQSSSLDFSCKACSEQVESATRFGIPKFSIWPDYEPKDELDRHIKMFELAARHVTNDAKIQERLVLLRTSN